jgi:hypothetical protein
VDSTRSGPRTAALFLLACWPACEPLLAREGQQLVVSDAALVTALRKLAALDSAPPNCCAMSNIVEPIKGPQHFHGKLWGTNKCAARSFAALRQISALNHSKHCLKHQLSVLITVI